VSSEFDLLTNLFHEVNRKLDDLSSETCRQHEEMLKSIHALTSSTQDQIYTLRTKIEHHDRLISSGKWFAGWLLSSSGLIGVLYTLYIFFYHPKP